MVIVFLLVFLSLGAFFALKRPNFLVAYYVIASTKFLGLFDAGSLIVGGTEVGYFCLNLIVLCAAFCSSTWYKIDRFIVPMYVVIACLMLAGIIIPYLNSYESIVQAVIASKSFFFFFFLVYVFGRQKEIDPLFVVKLLKFVGCYLSAVLIISFLFGVAPPLYKEIYDGGADYVRVYFPTYISMAAFLVYVDWQRNRLSGLSFLFVLSVLVFSMIIAAHLSIVLTTLAGIVGVNFTWHKRNVWRLKGTFLKIAAIVLVVVTGYGAITPFRLKVNTFFDVVLFGADVSLSSRERINEFRWDAISQSPVLGYGFIHKEAPIMAKFQTNEDNRFMQKLGVIDSGYVDLLVRFGYLGTFLYLLIVSTYIFSQFRLARPRLYSLAMAGFIFQYMAINYTWSVFTYAHGIIPLSLALYFLGCSQKRWLD